MRRFAKPLYGLTPVPRVRIPPSPPVILLKFRRCLLPADAFYEWRRSRSAKQPFCFEVNDGELFAFAGLWDGWKDPGGQWIKSCSILTTTPNAATSRVHDRMPVILSKDDYDFWLDPGMTNVEALSDVLRPF
jgi:putative SOS response-associated peptidase YedK